MGECFVYGVPLDVRFGSFTVSGGATGAGTGVDFGRLPRFIILALDGDSNPASLSSSYSILPEKGRNLVLNRNEYSNAIAEFTSTGFYIRINQSGGSYTYRYMAVM